MSRTPATRSGLAPSPIEQDLLAGITLARMWRDLEFLCGLDRASGTEGERRAMEYIATTLRAEGV